jgi:aminoglycoside phosphotransferase (APT) family kinase protein
MVKVGLPVPAALTTQPPAPHVVAQPVEGSQVSDEFEQVTGAPPHTPAVQTSGVVQTLASLHAVPSGAVTRAGHLGGPPPLRQLSDSRT